MFGDFRVYLSIVAVIMTLIGYRYYLADIFAGRTKPHAYSWLVWSVLTIVAFFGQISDGAGVGAWVTIVTGSISLFIFALALKYGSKDITTSDQINLAAAGFAVIPWILTDDAVWSIIIITVIDFLGFLPTIRKSIKAPYEETLIHYVFAGLKFALSIAALESFSLTTWLYPASLVLANWTFIALLLVQRRRTEPPVVVADL